MSYEKYGQTYNLNHPFAKPLFGKKKKQPFSVIFDEDIEKFYDDDGKHPLFKVSSGLPQSLGDALGDLDPDFASGAILSFIYGLRTFKAIKGKAQKLFSSVKEKAKAYNDKFTKGYDEVPVTETTTEDSLSGNFASGAGLPGFAPEITNKTLEALGLTSYWQLDKVKELKKELRPLRLVLNELTRLYLSTIEGEVEMGNIRIDDDGAKFLNKLSSLGLDAELVKRIRCLPPKDFKKFKSLLDFRFDEFKVWDSASRGYIMVEKPVLCTEPKNVVEKPWAPSNTWPQKAFDTYEPLGDIHNNQKLGSFEKEPEIDSSETDDED